MCCRQRLPCLSSVLRRACREPTDSPRLDPCMAPSVSGALYRYCTDTDTSTCVMLLCGGVKESESTGSPVSAGVKCRDARAREQPAELPLISHLSSLALSSLAAQMRNRRRPKTSCRRTHAVRSGRPSLPARLCSWLAPVGSAWLRLIR